MSAATETLHFHRVFQVVFLRVELHAVEEIENTLGLHKYLSVWQLHNLKGLVGGQSVGG